uniref:Pyrin domain-containing protein n=1 Tax=Xiphophorus couchianus TaxID=32473 RepID=A0A3B5MS51_9TELE
MGLDSTFEKLAGILDDIADHEFDNFKWHLKREIWNGIDPIKTSKLERAERLDIVDLMVQKYQVAGAITVTMIIMEKIKRNDLVKKLSEPSPEAPVEGQ